MGGSIEVFFSRKFENRQKMSHFCLLRFFQYLNFGGFFVLIFGLFGAKIQTSLKVNIARLRLMRHFVGFFNIVFL